MKQEPGLLVRKSKSGEERRWELNKPLITIGRWQDKDLVLDSRAVSRQHAQIRWEAGRYLLEDLSSKNGTFLNDRRLSRSEPLLDGDRIRIPPDFEFTFAAADATAPFRSPDQIEPIRLDTVGRRVWVQEQQLDPPLSPPQFALLALLAEQPGRAYSRSEIIDVVWPDVASEGVPGAAIAALVRRLRGRLAELDEHPRELSRVGG